MRKRLNSRRSAALVISTPFLGMFLSACAIVPGLQVDVDAPSTDSLVRTTEQGGENLVEVVDNGAVIQRFKIVKLDAASLLRHQGAGASDASLVKELGFVSPASVLPEYLIGPGDVLQIIVWDHPELTSPTGDFRDPVSAGRLVGADGAIFYPYVGVLPVDGKSPSEVRRILIDRLSKVIAKPQVDVRVVAYRAQRIQVIGEVAQPGVVTLDDTPKGVLEAISERGGLTETATRRSLTLIRDGARFSVDLGGLVSGARPAVNPPLKPGDVLHIPHRDTQQVVVLGEVREQSTVPLEQGDVSLTEVLAKVGGLDQARGSDSGVLVFRKAVSEGDTPTIFALDMDRPEGILLAGEFHMRPKDVVYVKTTGFAKYNSIIAQLLPTISAVFQIDALVNR